MKRLCRLPFGARHVWYLLVCSMEQLIGAALASIVGVIVPMIALTHTIHLSSFMQGVFAATSLTGIAFGSMIIGRLSDRAGYLAYFRICPILIMTGALVVWLLGHHLGWLLTGMLVCGVGVGGGYSLDSEYISELMPDKSRFICVGIAKATSSLGFILGAVGCYIIIGCDPHSTVWPALMLIIFGMGLLTLLMRLRWWESPAWYVAHGMNDRAQQAAKRFFGPDVVYAPDEAPAFKPAPWSAMFRGANLRKVIFTGVPWACEGVGVYGIGVFLPMLVSALGLMPETLHGVERVHTSVELTAWINFFILPGFILGLLIMHRVWHVGLLTWGFVVCAGGLGLLLAAHLLGWPIWVSIVGFFIFEIFLNAGPHLMTYVLPTQIYPVEDRGAGVGIASMVGKVGAIIGVLVMPVLLHAGGMKLVLIVSGIVMLAGAAVSAWMGSRVLPRGSEGCDAVAAGSAKGGGAAEGGA